MIILALDTATESCSVAIMEGNQLVAELNDFSGKTHAKHVMLMVQYVLDMAGLSTPAVDGYAITLGPGSFTGLRIGLSTVKGLAGAGEKPVIGVSTLHTLFEQAPQISPLVCPLIDARRSEVYASLYQLDDHGVTLLERDGVGPIEAILDRIDRPCFFIGSGVLQYKSDIKGRLGKLALFTDDYQNYPRAATIARMGIHRFKKGEADAIDTLTPYYIRKSDAQIQRVG